MAYTKEEREVFIRQTTSHAGEQTMLKALINDENDLDYLIENKDFTNGQVKTYINLESKSKRDLYWPVLKVAVEAKKLSIEATEQVEQHAGKIPEGIKTAIVEKITYLVDVCEAKDVTAELIQKAMQELKTELAKIEENINSEKADLGTAKGTVGRAIAAAKKLLTGQGAKIPSDIKSLLEARITDAETAKEGDDRNIIESAAEALKAQITIADEAVKNPAPKIESAAASVIQPSYEGNPHTKKMVLQSILNQLGFRGKRFADVITEIKSRYDGLMLEFKGIQFVLFHIIDDQEIQHEISSAGVMEGFKPLFETGKFVVAEPMDAEEKPKRTRQTQLLIDLFGLRFWNTAFPSLAKIPEDDVAKQFKQKVITETKKSITDTSFDVSEEELKDVDNAFDAAMYEFCTAVLQKL